VTVQSVAGAAPRCADAAQSRGDQLIGTAPPAARWLLVEQPGPWGRVAVRESRLDRAVAADISARAAVEGVRVQLIRRPGRNRPVPVRRWAYVDARPGRESSWWGSFSTDAGLLDSRFDGSAGARSAAPIYLVCTHGRHDTCCAIRGRPAAARLAAVRPDVTWECSHVGGDRFAANLVVLPHGLYYGHVTSDTAMEIVTAYEAGEIVPASLRGRSSVSRPAQAAQHHARLALGERGLDALRPLGEEALDGQAWQVLLERPGDQPVTVVVRAERSAERALLTCAATRAEWAEEYRLVSIEPRNRREPPG
jgi:(2Fe-2S) ferredoxin